jgi:hypothetical protein
MWTCRKCRERVDDEFQVCWQCGTSWDGVEDPAFVRTEDGRPEAETREPTDREDSPAESSDLSREESVGDSPQELPESVVELRGRRRFRLSGFATAGWLLLVLGMTGLLIPTVLRLPIWIDFEIVLGIWWTIWLGALTSLLYTGSRISDDHRLHEPRNWFDLARQKDKSTKSDSGWGSGWWPWMPMDGEGCVYFLAFLLILVALGALTWILIEVAIPLIVFLLYFVTRGMLSHVVNDRHRCRGRFARSLAWGLVWATAYMLPLAGTVWFVHTAWKRQ